MTLWTEGKDPSKRMWQCFSCSTTFENYEDYSRHILQEHDEGRDYVKCPVETCGAPVRDLRAHFTLKHPNRAIPKAQQMRATIWKDFSRKKGKGATKKPNFNEGWYESIKMSGKRIYHRSGYELEIYKCLDEDTDVTAYFAEPFKVPYYFNNDWHNYIPDIKIEFSDGTVEIWEIKPNTQMKYEQNQAKWKAMNEYAGKLGWGFTVINEKGINLLQKKIRDQKRAAQPINEVKPSTEVQTDTTGDSIAGLN